MEIDESIFKAYDVRGIYPTSINEEIAYRIGQGYARVINPTGKVVIGHDVRVHSEKLKKSMIKGLVDAGVDIVDIGLISTEMIYFATGNYGYAGGIQVTASHNPAEWHGAKFVRAGAEPISSDTGILDIKEFVKSGEEIIATVKGQIEEKDILEDFCRYVLTWIKPNRIKPAKICANPNFGYEGVVLNKIIKIGGLPVEVVELNYRPDGTFPKGRPDPFIPENRVELVESVLAEKADFGVAWDADADRVFFCTDKGEFLEPYFTNTILIEKVLKSQKNPKIVYDPRYSWALIDRAKEFGGEAVLERVGHSFIKARMRKENAVFSGESSGHTYYRDFWFADTGIIPLLQMLEITSEKNKTLHELVRPVMAKYFISGEKNFTTEKAAFITAELEKKYSDSQINKIDGLSCEYPDWRFNLRSSNTEPLLRLNLEAKSKHVMEEKLAELMQFIESNK